MKPLLSGLLLLVSTHLAFARDFRPAWHLENILLADSSVQQCYVIETTPGIHYTIEFSNNLGQWTPLECLYGLGGEYAVAMREFTPAPPPPPGTSPANPAALPTNVSLRIQPASGAAGGSVVAWRSLDHGGPVIVRIAGEMDAGWNSIPIFWNRFGTYNFYFWHPGTPITPPADNPSLGPKDSAMLAVLEASVPDINLQIAASILQSRNAPPPAPPDPDSRRFWRVKVDWGLDTDHDGSPDWAEYEIAARSTGMMVPGVVGDAFNADTNNDGIPDGEQLDADLDGTSDARDADSTDNTTVMPLGPIPRYALFEIPGKAIQINDLGTVILPEKVWKNGVLSDLPGGGANSPLASARGINDLDVILGTANRDPNGTDFPMNLPGRICYWPGPTQPYQYVEVVENGQTVQAYVDHDGFRSQGPAPILSLSGHFIAQSFATDPAPGYTDPFDSLPTLWQLPSGATPASRQAAPQFAVNLSSPSLIWGGNSPEDTVHAGRIHGPVGLPPLPFAPFNVIAQSLPNGGSALFATNGQTDPFDENAGIHATLVYDGQKWRPNETYANAVDIANDGIAIGKNLPGKTAPILLNGKWTGIEGTAPGLPAPWKDSTVTLRDTTPSGWILAHRGLSSVEDPVQSAALLPIKVDGVDPDYIPPQVPQGQPLPEPPEFLAGGVDRISMMASGGVGRAQEIWIMAPNGGASNTVRFRSPVSETSKLTLAPRETPGQPSDPDVGFIPDILNERDMKIQVSGKKSDSADTEPFLKLGGTLKAINVPLRIKVMKKRTVRVAVHKVFGLNQLGNQTAPANFPSEDDLKIHLNKIYGRQVNTFFKITIHEEKGINNQGIAFDSNHDGEVAVSELDPELIAATPNAKSDGIGPQSEANIDIWVIGGGVKLNGSQKRHAFGANYSTIGLPKIIIDGDLSGYEGTPEEKSKLALHVFAHEIGHAMIGSGHPDQGTSTTVLNWSESYPNGHTHGPYDKRRLMCSGENVDFSDFGKQIIKKEWDKIESWLRDEEAAQKIIPE